MSVHDEDKPTKECKEFLFDLRNSELQILINEWIKSERDRHIMKRRLIDGICFEPLAEEFELSVRQIKNIVYKGENKIFKKMH